MGLDGARAWEARKTEIFRRSGLRFDRLAYGAVTSAVHNRVVLSVYHAKCVAWWDPLDYLRVFVTSNV